RCNLQPSASGKRSPKFLALGGLGKLNHAIDELDVNGVADQFDTLPRGKFRGIKGRIKKSLPGCDCSLSALWILRPGGSTQEQRNKAESKHASSHHSSLLGVIPCQLRILAVRDRTKDTKHHHATESQHCSHRDLLRSHQSKINSENRKHISRLPVPKQSTPPAPNVSESSRLAGAHPDRPVDSASGKDPEY